MRVKERMIYRDREGLETEREDLEELLGSGRRRKVKGEAVKEKGSEMGRRKRSQK